MDNVLSIKECKCGNKEMVSNYNYVAESLYEVCDVCGYYHTAAVTNLIDDGKYPEGWSPELSELEGVGFVFKVFQKGSYEYNLSCIEKKNVALAIESLKKENNIERFAVTFKDKLGNYQTQIYLIK